MAKFLLILGLFIGILFLFRLNQSKWLKGGDPSGKAKPQPKAKQKSAAARQTPSTALVTCQVCHVLLPSNEGWWRGERSYCSQEHLEQDRG